MADKLPSINNIIRRKAASILGVKENEILVTYNLPSNAGSIAFGRDKYNNSQYTWFAAIDTTSGYTPCISRNDIEQMISYDNIRTKLDKKTGCMIELIRFDLDKLIDKSNPSVFEYLTGISKSILNIK